MAELTKISMADARLPDPKSLTSEQRETVKAYRAALRKYGSKRDDFDAGKRKDRPTWPLARPSVVKLKSGRYRPRDEESELILLAHELEGYGSFRAYIVPAEKARAPKEDVPIAAQRSVPQKSTATAVAKKAATTPAPSVVLDAIPAPPANSSLNEEFVELFDWEAFNALAPSTRKARIMHIIDVMCKQFTEIDRRRFLVALMRYLGDEGVIVPPTDLYSPNYARNMELAWRSGMLSTLQK